MINPKLMLTLASCCLAWSENSTALTMEERMAAMEKKMLQMQDKLEHTEAENQELKHQLMAPMSLPMKTDNPVIKNMGDKITVLEKRLEYDKNAAAETAKKAPKIDISNKGLAFKSADENYKFSLRGYAQADTNFFIDETETTINDKFTIRRARLSLDGTLFKAIDFRIAPDFAGSQTRLFDAFVDLHYFPSASLMVGKFRQPVSLERMQTAPNLTFIERAYPAQLAPNRDLGIMLHGAIAYPGYKAQYTPQPLFKEFLGYEIGVFNGIRDNQAVQNSDSDRDNNKELAARLFMHPFMHSNSLLQGLGIGVSGTWGRPKNNALSSLVSPGQQTLLSYNAGATSSGYSHRVYPQMYWYWQSFGLMAEYLFSSQQLHGVKAGKEMASVRQENSAWHVNMSYVLTGEKNSFFGIKPTTNFDPVAGTWGAFQVAARWSELDIDDSSFENYGTSKTPFYLVDPSQSISRAQSWAVGLNWILNENIKIMSDYEQTYFTGGGLNHSNRAMEKAFFSRFQFAF